MKGNRTKSPSESRGFPKGGLVPLWRRTASGTSLHFPQKMRAPKEVFGC